MSSLTSIGEAFHLAADAATILSGVFSAVHAYMQHKHFKETHQHTEMREAGHRSTARHGSRERQPRPQRSAPMLAAAAYA